MDEVRAPEMDVVLSSRVRLARNYKDIPFAPLLTKELADETIRRAQGAIESGEDKSAYRLLRMCELSPFERSRLVEHHLISYDLLKFTDKSAALISTGETVSIMVNEEDHLRIQGLMPGLQLERTCELAFTAEGRLSAGAPFAFDAQWGYLTSCPTNTGTGMRASTMLHLPALSTLGQINAIIQAIAKLGMTVRGLYGEGSDASGNLFQLSNQVTLGRTEEDVIQSLNAATLQIVGHERAAREQELKKDRALLLDKLMRSAGILANARIMPQTEFMKRYSDLRLASCLNLIAFPLGELDKLMMDLQPASLGVSAGKDLNDRERDMMRADLIRKRLKG